MGGGRRNRERGGKDRGTRDRAIREERRAPAGKADAADEPRRRHRGGQRERAKRELAAARAAGTDRGEGPPRRERGGRGERSGREPRPEREALKEQRRDERRTERRAERERDAAGGGGVRSLPAQLPSGFAEAHERHKLPPEAKHAERAHIGGLHVALPLPHAHPRIELMPFRQRVFVAKSAAAADAVAPSYFAQQSSFTTPAPPEAPAELIEFSAWGDCTIREVVENVRRYLREHPVVPWFDDADSVAEVAAVFPGADGVASKAVIGTLRTNGPVGDLDQVPLNGMWTAAEKRAGKTGAATGALPTASPADDALNLRRGLMAATSAGNNAPPLALAPALSNPRTRVRAGDILLIQPIMQSA
jgi:hypothetical protein